MSLVSFRSSFTSTLHKKQNPTLSTMPSKSNVSQTNNFKSFKQFTYQALNQNQNSSQKQKLNQINENDEDEMNKCNVSANEEENDSKECVDVPLNKMGNYSKELTLKKNLTLENNTLQFDQLISQYYFNNNSNKEKINANAVQNLKDILVEISRKQRIINEHKKELKKLQIQLNDKYKNQQTINNADNNSNSNNKAYMFLTERNKTYSQSSNNCSLFVPSIAQTKTTVSSTSSIPTKIQVQNRYIKFKELVSKIKMQIIEQKKKNIMNKTLPEIMS